VIRFVFYLLLYPFDWFPDLVVLHLNRNLKKNMKI